MRDKRFHHRHFLLGVNANKPAPKRCAVVICFSKIKQRIEELVASTVIGIPPRLSTSILTAYWHRRSRGLNDWCQWCRCQHHRKAHYHISTRKQHDCWWTLLLIAADALCECFKSGITRWQSTTQIYSFKFWHIRLLLFRCLGNTRSSTSSYVPGLVQHGHVINQYTRVTWTYFRIGSK